MKQKKIGHIGFKKKKKAFRSRKKSRKKVEREKKLNFYSSGIYCTLQIVDRVKWLDEKPSLSAHRGKIVIVICIFFFLAGIPPITVHR
jgi:hypothetical protein